MDIETALVTVTSMVLVVTGSVITDPLWYQLTSGGGNPSETQVMVVLPPKVTNVVLD